MPRGGVQGCAAEGLALKCPLNYLERVAEFDWRSSGPPFLPVASVSVLSADFVSSSCADLLRDQRHDIPHELVQIERQDRPRPCHLQRMPKTLFGFVELVPIAF